MVAQQKSETSQQDRIIAILGPTATGKTTRAVELARLLNGEIVSADSRQVYRGMDIGTGKDLEEYGEIPYHLIDICAAGEKYNLHRYITDFRNIIHSLQQRKKQAIVCGGTGMYIENALSGVVLPEVPENTKLRNELSDKSLEELTLILKDYKILHNKTDIDTTKRAIRAIEIGEYYRQHPEEAKDADRKNVNSLDALIIGIDISREDRRRRISNRLESRLANGMVEEVEKLLSQGISPEDLIYYGLEYKFLTLHVTGQLSYEEMHRQLEIAIHQFAKRQMTWFRGMEKRGFKIHWLPYNLPREEFNERVLSLMNEGK
ncbi:MAG: tRNA (adenosine(37)-N6)-dimethylallyltransferase MiaA [Muribaculaceae bacterium]|nr:tRNA (adenosine(37)-N6)-dimethylallyltransferase MiaA [Muribaculaceae bacterium]